MSILSAETVASTVLKVRLVLQRGHLQLMREFRSSSGLNYGPSSNRGVASSFFSHDTSSFPVCSSSDGKHEDFQARGPHDVPLRTVLGHASLHTVAG